MSKVEIGEMSTTEYSVEVTVKKTIRVDGVWKISGCLAYDLAPGTVVVTDIVTPEDYRAIPHRFREIQDYMQPYLITDNSTSEDIDLYDTIVNKTIWVIYKYRHCYIDEEYTDYTFALPLEDFASYTSFTE